MKGIVFGHPVLVLVFVIQAVMKCQATFCSDRFDKLELQFGDHLSRCSFLTDTNSQCCDAEKSSLEDRWDKYMKKLCNGCKKDLLIVLDTSNSIGRSTFDHKVKPFLKNLVAHRVLNVGPHGTRIGIIIFSDTRNTRVLLDFGEKTSNADLKKFIESNVMDWNQMFGDQTRTGLALNMANKIFSKNSPYNVRRNIADVVMIITDGEPNGRGLEEEIAYKNAKALRDKDVLMIGIAVGPRANKHKIVKMVNFEDNTFSPTFDSLWTIMDKLVDTTCKPFVPDCNCTDDGAGEFFIPPGQTTLKVRWDEPKFQCKNRQPTDFLTTVSPNVKPPHKFSLGHQRINYTYTFMLFSIKCYAEFNILTIFVRAVTFYSLNDMDISLKSHRKTALDVVCGDLATIVPETHYLGKPKQIDHFGFVKDFNCKMEFIQLHLRWCKKDLLILLDTSTSIGRFAFKRTVKPFLKNLLAHPLLNVGPHGTQIGIIIFSNKRNTKVLLKFGQKTSKADLKKFIDSNDMDWNRVSGDRTRTGLALNMANKIFSKNSPYNVRRNVADVVMIITGGEPRGPRGRRLEMETAYKSAKALRDKHVRMVGIAVGPRVNTFKDTIVKMVNSKNNTFDESFDSLWTIVGKLVDASCKPFATACSCPNTSTVVAYLKHGESTVGVTWTVPKPSCPATETSVIPKVSPGSPFQLGKHTVKYLYRMDAGFDLTCSVNIEVKDTQMTSQEQTSDSRGADNETQPS